MGITIITPHYNDFEGIKQAHGCIMKQDTEDWEWIIVDDFSDIPTRESLTKYFEQYSNSNIKLILSDKKTTGSVCRNIGIEHASNNHLVFLDSDDIILEDFVSNRLVEVEDFIVYKNFNLLDISGNSKPFLSPDSKYLDYFLQAKFIWQTSSILWNKNFLISIGKFNPDLKRLQDVELSIRALILGKHYEIINNKVDFYYCVKPIEKKNRPIIVICESVNYLINYFYENYTFTKPQKKLIKGYYFMNIKYLERSKSVKDVPCVNKNLKLFYNKGFFSLTDYLLGLLLLKLYQFEFIRGSFFLRANRRLFKP